MLEIRQTNFWKILVVCGRNVLGQTKVVILATFFSRTRIFVWKIIWLKIVFVRSANKHKFFPKHIWRASDNNCQNSRSILGTREPMPPPTNHNFICFWAKRVTEIYISCSWVYRLLIMHKICRFVSPKFELPIIVFY